MIYTYSDIDNKIVHNHHPSPTYAQPTSSIAVVPNTSALMHCQVTIKLVLSLALILPADMMACLYMPDTKLVNMAPQLLLCSS